MYVFAIETWSQIELPLIKTTVRIALDTRNTFSFLFILFAVDLSSLLPCFFVSFLPSFLLQTLGLGTLRYIFSFHSSHKTQLLNRAHLSGTLLGTRWIWTYFAVHVARLHHCKAPGLVRGDPPSANGDAHLVKVTAELGYAIRSPIGFGCVNDFDSVSSNCKPPELQLLNLLSILHQVKAYKGRCTEVGSCSG